MGADLRARRRKIRRRARDLALSAGSAPAHRHRGLPARRAGGGAERLDELGLAEPSNAARRRSCTSLASAARACAGVLAGSVARQAFLGHGDRRRRTSTGRLHPMPRACRTAPLTLEEVRAPRDSSATASARSCRYRPRSHARATREVAAEERAERAGGRSAALERDHRRPRRAAPLAGGAARRGAEANLVQPRSEERARRALALRSREQRRDAHRAARRGSSTLGRVLAPFRAALGGPFIVADATQPAEREVARWLDPERSPHRRARWHLAPGRARRVAA